MTKSAQEILAEWADPETGGTMPKEVREAALSVLRLVAEWNQPTPESEWQKMCNRALRAEDRVKELEAEVDELRARWEAAIAAHDTTEDCLAADARIKELSAELAKALRV